jgi:hypothetical protein
MRNLVKRLQGAKLHLFVSKTGARLAYSPYPWQPTAVSLLDVTIGGAPESDPAALIAPLAPALGDRRYAGLALSVTLSDEWVRLFMVAPPKNTLRMQDVRTAVAMRFHMLYGDDPARWRLTCDDGIDRRFLACAMPAALFQAIQQLCNAYGLRLASLSPSFVATWNLVHRRLGRAWFGVVHDETITIGCVEAAPKPELAAVHRLRLPLDYHEGWLADQLRGVALRHGLHNPRELKLFGRYVADLNVPGDETGLVVTWPEQAERDRPRREPLVDLAGIGGARA